MKNLQTRLKKYLNENYNLNERMKALRNRKLYSLEIELTNTCNLSCIYCYARAKGSGIFLPVDKAKQIIKQASEYGIKRIAWLGGEPLTHPRWHEIISFAKETGLKNEIWSNGYLLSAENRKRVVDLVDVFILHLDTVNSENFCRTQGRSKNCKKIHSLVIQRFKKLLEEEYPARQTRIAITLTRNIFKELEQTLKFFLKELEVETSILIPVYEAGRGLTLPKDYFLSKQEVRESFQKRSEIEKRPELMLLGPSELCKHYQCSCAYAEVNGDVLPYAAMDDVVVGNIYKEDLKSILERSFEKLSFADYKVGRKCANCKNSKYCFGTFAAAHIAGTELDPHCWLL